MASEEATGDSQRHNRKRKNHQLWDVSVVEIIFFISKLTFNQTDLRDLQDLLEDLVWGLKCARGWWTTKGDTTAYLA